MDDGVSVVIICQRPRSSVTAFWVNFIHVQNYLSVEGKLKIVALR